MYCISFFFFFLAKTNNTEINIQNLRISLYIVFYFYEIGSYEYIAFMCIFNFNRCCQIAFQTGCMLPTSSSIVWSTLSPTSQSALDSTALFWFCQADECEVIYHLFSICLFLTASKLNIFSYAYWSSALKNKEVFFVCLFSFFGDNLLGFFKVYLRKSLTDPSMWVNGGLSRQLKLSQSGKDTQLCGV